MVLFFFQFEFPATFKLATILHLAFVLMHVFYLLVLSSAFSNVKELRNNGGLWQAGCLPQNNSFLFHSVFVFLLTFVDIRQLISLTYAFTLVVFTHFQQLFRTLVEKAKMSRLFSSLRSLVSVNSFSLTQQCCRLLSDTAG